MAASRKLYVAMADTIARHVSDVDTTDPRRQTINQLVRDLAYDLKQDNMAFDRERFLTACGLS